MIFDSSFRYYFYNPAFDIDANGAYHVIAYHHSIDCWWKCYHDRYLVYRTNSGAAAASVSLTPALTKNAVAVDGNDVHIAYNAGGNVIYATPSDLGGVALTPGSDVTIDALGNRIGIGYVYNSAAHYIESQGGFGTPESLGAGTGKPVIGLGSTFILYQYQGDLFLTGHGSGNEEQSNDDQTSGDVPEFSVIGAALMLAGLGYYMHKKRN